MLVNSGQMKRKAIVRAASTFTYSVGYAKYRSLLSRKMCKVKIAIFTTIIQDNINLR